MNIITKRSLQAIIAGSALVSSFALAGTAFAAGGPNGFGPMKHPAIAGIVATVSGNTLTVTAKGRAHGSATDTPTTYTVDATSATVTKGGAASTVSAIVVGDTVVIQGTLTGTNVVATKIIDGKTGRLGTSGQKPVAPTFQGNGQPVIGGNVTVVSGSVITVTNRSNVTYTVDATHATITKAGVTGTATIGNVVIGDSVVVQGTVNGNAVVAASVLDQGTPPTATGATGITPPAHRGILGSIGGFFAHLFGF